MSVTSRPETQSSADRPEIAVRSPSPWLFRGGVVLSLAAIGVFVAQVAWAQMLVTPWYMPVIGTVAAGLVLSSLAGRMRWWRVGVGMFCVFLAAFEWFFILGGTVLPAYAGPIHEGSSVPAFAAKLADGTEIHEDFFQQQPITAVIFYQGRWCPFCVTQLKDLEAHHAEFDHVGAKVAVVSIEDLKTVAKTQSEFPHLNVVSDEKRELSNAIELIHRDFGPNGDCDFPTMLLVDQSGIVKWFHRPKSFIARPSATELVAMIEQKLRK